MSAKQKLTSAIQSIDDAGKVLKRLKSAIADADLDYQLRKAMRELDQAKQYIERARQEVSSNEA